MSNPEQHLSSAERTAELERTAAERSLEIQKSNERTNGEELEKQIEEAREARQEADRQALPTEKLQQEEQIQENTIILAKSKTPEKAFNETMEVVQKQMSVPSRIFSKVIHNKIVEETSEAVGVTIARPNSILSGSVCALLLVTGLYVHAKYIGYSLSGFETIGAFLLGWIIGLVFDLIRTLLRRS